MKTVYRYYKNSNTGEVMKGQEFTEIKIKGIPIYYYGLDGKGIGENLPLDGFVEISEKKWNRYQRQQKTNNKESINQ